MKVNKFQSGNVLLSCHGVKSYENDKYKALFYIYVLCLVEKLNYSCNILYICIMFIKKHYFRIKGMI